MSSKQSMRFKGFSKLLIRKFVKTLKRPCHSFHCKINRHLSKGNSMAETDFKPVYRIMDLHESDRPRERLASLGPQALSNAELIAILLRVGVKGESAVTGG